MSQAAPPPTPPERPGSPLTIVSWIVLFGGLLVTFCVYQFAVAHRQSGELLPGLSEALVGIAATAVGCFGCGLAALLRRERCRSLALLPFLAGLGTILFFAWNLITRR